jgi:hypothetical protein
MMKTFTVLGLGIGAALCVAALELDVAPAVAQMAGYRLAADEIPGDKSLIAPEGAQEESSGNPPHHEPPIRFVTVDYQDAGDAGGKVTLAGTAPAGTVLYIFFDDNPFAKLAVDDQGKWSVEKQVKLENGNHTIRADVVRPRHGHDRPRAPWGGAKGSGRRARRGSGASTASALGFPPP